MLAACFLRIFEVSQAVLVRICFARGFGDLLEGMEPSNRRITE